MMNLTLMDRTLRTLDGKGGVLEPILQHWEYDTGSLQFLRASANIIFTFTRGGSPRILRFSHLSERSTEAVKSELDVIHYLISRGARVVTPVVSSDGHDVARVATPLGTFNATVFEFIVGAQPDCSEMTEGMFTRWGSALAQLHNAIAGYRAAGRPDWQEHLAYVAEHLAPELTDAQALLQTVRQKLATHPVGDATFGLIHFDFEPDNLVWQDSHVWAVDFDDCAYYPFAADIAFALREPFGDRPSGVDLEDARVRAFIAGYRELRAMDDAELENIPLFLAAHNLLTFTKLEHSLAGAHPKDEPDWLVALRQRLEQKRLEYLQGFAEVAL